MTTCFSRLFIAKTVHTYRRPKQCGTHHHSACRYGLYRWGRYTASRYAQPTRLLICLRNVNVPPLAREARLQTRPVASLSAISTAG